MTPNPYTAPAIRRAAEGYWDECAECDETTQHCPHGKCLICEGCGRCFPFSEKKA